MCKFMIYINSLHFFNTNLMYSVCIMIYINSLHFF